jgi:WD40 repeat protein
MQHDRNAAPIALMRHGAALLTAGQDKTLRLWDVCTGQPLSELIPQESWITCDDPASDGRRIALAFTDHAVRVWDFGQWKCETATSPRLVAETLQHDKKIHTVRFSADGSRIVTASADGTARVWNATNGQPVTASLVHSGEVVTAQFSPDGRMVVTASEDHTARLWDALNGRPLTEPLAHRDHVRWAEFSPNGDKVATASTDDTACLWDARTGRKLLTLQHARIAFRAVFSPDGQRILTACLDRTAQIWDANTGQALTPPLRHDSPLMEVYFSSNAQCVFTAAWRGTGRMWDSGTGRPVSERLTVKDPWGVCFDPASGRFIVGATNGIAAVWNVPEVPVPVPEWFPKFAEALAGIRLGEHGNVELVSRQMLKDFAKQIPASATSSEYERLARWFLEDEHRR